MSVIVAFDPGLTVGSCIFVPGEKAMKLLHVMHLHSVRAVAYFLSDVKLRYPAQDVTVVAESFARGNSVVKEQILTLRMCGAIEALAAEHGFHYEEQYPAQRTGYVPVAKKMITELGFGTLKENHHSIDAVAHAMCFMDKEGLEWQKQFWLRKAIQ